MLFFQKMQMRAKRFFIALDIDKYIYSIIFLYIL